MELMMNGLLTVATLFAGGYCWVLARRVQNLKSLDKGLGGSIVALTRQIELARTTLEEARAASKASHQDLAQLVAKADAAAGQLRMLIAAAPLPTTPSIAPDPAPGAETPQPRRSRGKPALRDLPPEPLLSAEEQAEPADEPEKAAVVEVPKPRTLLPIENPLRRFRTEATQPVPSNED